jgi:hypothetical protein
MNFSHIPDFPQNPSLRHTFYRANGKILYRI